MKINGGNSDWCARWPRKFGPEVQLDVTLDVHLDLNLDFHLVIKPKTLGLYGSSQSGLGHEQSVHHAVSLGSRNDSIQAP
jgi:hypothetical protein